MRELTCREVSTCARLAASFERATATTYLALAALAQGPATAGEVAQANRALRCNPNAAPLVLRKLVESGLALGFGAGPETVYALSAAGLAEVEKHFGALREKAERQREERVRGKGR